MSLDPIKFAVQSAMEAAALRAELDRMALDDVDEVRTLLFGDLPGHEFRGNQWTSNAGKSATDIAADTVQDVHDKSSGDKMVTLDMQKLDEAWQRDLGGQMYIGAGGIGHTISDRYERFKQFVATTDKRIIAPTISLNERGGTVSAQFGNGRHRTAVLRDLGARHIAVSLSKESVPIAMRHGFVVSKAQMSRLDFGDVQGHEFHGNQWTGGYSVPAEMRAKADAIKAMSVDQRDNLDIYEYGYSAYTLYEAEKMMPKKEGTMRNITAENSHALWQHADAVANVNGHAYLATKQEDPDDEEATVWNFNSPADVNGKGFDTPWSDKKQAIDEFSKALKEGKVKLSRSLAFGDVQGHEFHGNQWTGGMGGDQHLMLKVGRNTVPIIHNPTVAGFNSWVRDYGESAQSDGLYRYIRLDKSNETFIWPSGEAAHLEVAEVLRDRGMLNFKDDRVMSFLYGVQTGEGTTAQMRSIARSFHDPEARQAAYKTPAQREQFARANFYRDDQARDYHGRWTAEGGGDQQNLHLHGGVARPGQHYRGAGKRGTVPPDATHGPHGSHGQGPLISRPPDDGNGAWQTAENGDGWVRTNDDGTQERWRVGEASPSNITQPSEPSSASDAGSKSGGGNWSEDGEAQGNGESGDAFVPDADALAMDSSWANGGTRLVQINADDLGWHNEKSISVIKNPTHDEVQAWAQVHEVDEVRIGINPSNGDVFAWNGGKAIHQPVMHALGLGNREQYQPSNGNFDEPFTASAYRHQFNDWIGQGGYRGEMSDTLKSRLTNRQSNALQGDFKPFKDRGDFARRLKFYSEDQARDYHGRWMDMGEIFVSPNQEEGGTFAGAMLALHSEQQAKLRALATDISIAVAGGGTVEDAVGDWSDGAENSMVVMVNNAEATRYVAAVLGSAANQKAVIPFVPSKDGADSVWRIEAKGKGIDTVRADLDAHGIQYRTLTPGQGSTRITVFDQGTQLTDSMNKLGKYYGTTAGYVRGAGEFLGGDTREAGQAAYAQVIKQWEAGHVAYPRSHIRLSRQGHHHHGRDETALKFYSEDQARDDHGRWTAGQTAFLKELDAGTYDNPLMRNTRVMGKKEVETGKEHFANIEVYPSSEGRINVASIQSLNAGERQGTGTMALEMLTDLADKHGVPLELYAKHYGDKGLRTPQLIGWYKRHGFEPDTKRLMEGQKAGRSFPYLVRQPKAKMARPHGERTHSLAAFTSAEQRVSFSTIEDRSDKLAGLGVTALASLVAAAVWRAIKASKDTAPSDAVFAGSDMARIKKTCIGVLKGGWGVGETEARDELERANAPAKFKRMNADVAAEWLDANGFRMAGNLADGARAIIQQELINGLKNGVRPEDTAKVIYERLINKGFTTLEGVQGAVDERDVVDAMEQAFGTTTEKGTAAYLNNLVRTNTFAAINEARFAQFTDPALGGYVEGFEYSAILDDRTTEICQALDGFKASADSAEWDTYNPPNHYNCRSLLIPITALDNWDGVDDPHPSVEPQDGFGAGEK